MKNLIVFLGLLVGMMSAQSQTLATFDGANKANLSFRWTEIDSVSEQMQIADLCVEFVAEEARMTHETSITNHITKSPTRTSSEGQVIKGKLYSDGKVIGIARFAVIGTSMAGTADIGNDTYKFRPDKDGNYAWELEAPFVCGTDDEHRNCDVQTPGHVHGADCEHDHQLSSGPKSPMSCVTESIQDVAFVTDDLLALYGNDLNAILAQIAISDSWATDIMEDSGFPDIAFFQESVNVVNFNEAGSTYGNSQAFSDSLYGNGVIAGIMQSANSPFTVLYSFGGGSAAGAAVVSVYPMPSGSYYELVLGNNGGLGNYVKTHECGHALWGGEHENQTPNPVIYRRAYAGVDATWGQYCTVMGRGDFPGPRMYCFSTSAPGASYYHTGFGQSFSPIGSSDRDMVTRITQEWNRPGIVQVVTIPSPTVTTHPSDVTVCEGDPFDLVAAGNNVDWYQWYHDGSAISGATSATYSVSSASAGDAGSYYCELGNSCDVVNTNTAIVTVNPLVAVTQQPSSVTVLEGGSFTLTTAGTNVVSYQWYHGGSPISGATSASYSVTSATSGDAGSYYCELTNGCGSVNTNAVTVTVTPLMLTINPTSVTVSASSGNTSFVITSNESWSIVTSDSYVIATPSSGSGNSSINVSYPAITTMAGETYTCTITSASNIVQIFTINQSGVSAFITLTPDQANVPATAGSLTFNVDCPSDLIWDVTGLASWLSAAPLSGMGPGTVTLNYAANPNQTSRSDDFSVSGSGETDVFQITQVGTNASLEAYANSDKGVYSLGQTVQLWGSATGGTGSYSYEWTGTGGFTSQLQNPTVTPSSEGSYTYTLIVNDGSNTATDNVVVGVWEVSFYLEATPMNGTTDDEFLFHSEIIQNANDPRTVDYHSIDFGDGNLFEGSGNIIEVVHTYLLAGTYDIEQSYILSDGSSDSKTSLNFIGVITDVIETELDKIKVYPNPTNGIINITGTSLETVSIVDITGREVFHQENLGENARIDLSTFPSGFYFVRLLVDGVFITSKVMKR